MDKISKDKSIQISKATVREKRYVCSFFKYYTLKQLFVSLYCLFNIIQYKYLSSFFSILCRKKSWTKDSQENNLDINSDDEDDYDTHILNNSTEDYVEIQNASSKDSNSQEYEDEDDDFVLDYDANGDIIKDGADGENDDDY